MCVCARVNMCGISIKLTTSFMPKTVKYFVDNFFLIFAFDRKFTYGNFEFLKILQIFRNSHIFEKMNRSSYNVDGKTLFQNSQLKMNLSTIICN